MRPRGPTSLEISDPSPKSSEPSPQTSEPNPEDSEPPCKLRSPALKPHWGKKQWRNFSAISLCATRIATPRGLALKRARFESISGPCAAKHPRNFLAEGPRGPEGGAKRRPIPKGARRAPWPQRRPLGPVAERRRRDRRRFQCAYKSTSQQEHGYSSHGQDKLGSTATTRRVKE